MERTIFHIDVNSAYLSWTAVEQLKNGAQVDLREIPSIIGGDIASRRGIVLAKSISAKAFGIVTGEPVSHALQKCPNLVSASPDHKLYSQYSRRFISLLKNRFCDKIEQVSVDECYMDFTEKLALYPSAIVAATLIKDTIYDTFGFTVNVGISNNKLLAKMASDFKKPNLVHTLYPYEVPTKMWPLPVGDLFMVGKSTAAALKKLDIHTIGDLANADPAIITSHLKSHGQLIWAFANGMDDSPVVTEEADNKCVGHSTTLPKDVTSSSDAKKVLYSLSQQVSSRLKSAGQLAGMVSTEIKYASFTKVSHQMQIETASDDTKIIYETASQLFDELWNGEPIRLLGVRTSKLTMEVEPVQMSLFDLPKTQKELKADRAMEDLKKRFGDGVIKKGW